MNQQLKLDKAKIRQAFAVSAKRYDDYAQLQRMAAEQLLQMFPVAETPGLILDLGCGTGYLSGLINDQSGRQAPIALDLALPMLQRARQKQTNLARRLVCADAENLPFASQSFQQIYSNLAVQWCDDLPRVFAECQRVLSDNGQLALATFGPETLKELKQAWTSVDSFAHVNSFIEIEQILNALSRSGFKSLTWQAEIYRRNYASVLCLMHELKGLGAHNVNLDRNRKNTTPAQLQQLISNYTKLMPNGQIYASYEIFYIRARG